MDPRALGARCDECPLQGQRPVCGHGRSDATFVVVGEAPGPEEVNQGVPFVGASGRMLHGALAAARMSDSDVYKTNVVACRPRGDGNMQDLLDEIQKANKAEAKRFRKEAKAYEAWEKKAAKVLEKNDKAADKYQQSLAKLEATYQKSIAKVVEQNQKIMARWAKRGLEAPDSELHILPERPEPPAPPPPLPLPPGPPPPEPAREVKDPVECCRPRLERETAKAKTLLLVGGLSLQAFTPYTSIMAEQGAPIALEDGRWALAVLHPAAILRGLEHFRFVFRIFVSNAVRLWREGGCSWVDPDPIYTPWRVALALEQLLAQADQARREGAPFVDVAWDIETSSTDPSTGHIRCMAFAWGESSVAVLPLRNIEGEPVSGTARAAGMARRVLAHPWIRKIPHNGIFDISYSRYHGWDVKPPFGDTLGAHHSTDSEMPHDLEFVSKLVLFAPTWKHMVGGDHGVSETNYDRLLLYNSIDAYRTKKAHDALEPVVKKDGVEEVYQNWCEILNCDADMQQYGFRLIPDRQKEIRDRLLSEKLRCEAEMADAMAEILAAAPPDKVDAFNRALDGEPFGYTRPAHKEAMLVLVGADEFLQRTEKTKALQTGAEPLSGILHKLTPIARRWVGSMLTANARGNGFLGALSAQKFIATFCEAETSPDGRVHASWKMHGTPTGRRSCAEPNLQNIPDWLRAMYGCDDGFVLIGMDYAALELWVIAIYTQATALLEAMKHPDPHRVNAQGLFAIDFAVEVGKAADDPWTVARSLAEVPPPCPTHGYQMPGFYRVHDPGKTAELKVEPLFDCPHCRMVMDKAVAHKLHWLKDTRRLAKSFVYAVNYQAQDTTIWMNMLPDFPSLQLSQVTGMQRRWNEVNPQIKNAAYYNLDLYSKRKYRTGMGWIRSPILRRPRYWPKGDPQITDVANFPIQSGGADIIDIGLRRAYPRFKPLGARYLAHGHDALYLEVPEMRANQVMDILAEEMPGKHRLRGIDEEFVPGEWSFPIESKVGKLWSEV